MLMECVKEWNLKDDNGVDVILNEENLLALDIPTINIITEEITKLITNDQNKKK